MPELLAQKLRALRGDMSIRDLSHATVRLGDTGIGERTIQLLESKPGRVPEADILEALAAALDVDPSEFYEYPIAVARREAGSTEAARKKREADALRKHSARQAQHPEDAPDATPTPRRLKRQAP